MNDKSPSPTTFTPKDSAARYIAGKILACQLNLSKRLNKNLAKLSVKQLQFFLIAFCVTGGGVSAYTSIHALQARSVIHQPGMPVSITIPQNIKTPGYHPPLLVSDSLFKLFDQFHALHDSLQIPMSKGLADSIQFFENRYNRKTFPIK